MPAPNERQTMHSCFVLFLNESCQHAPYSFQETIEHSDHVINIKHKLVRPAFILLYNEICFVTYFFIVLYVKLNNVHIKYRISGWYPETSGGDYS